MANDGENDEKRKQSKSVEGDWRPKDATEAREVLRRFVVRARRVNAHSMVQDHSVDRYAEPTVRSDDVLPDQEVFESLAARARPCILEREPIYLGKMFGSIELLLGGRRLPEEDSSLLDVCRNDFQNLLDKDGGHYAIQLLDKNGNPESEALSDLLIGDGWLYGDLVHADPKGAKVEAMKFSYHDRFFAATSLFSMLAIVIVRTFEVVTDLNERLGLGIDNGAWEEQVVITDRDNDDVISDRIVLAPMGDVEAVFLRGRKVIGRTHATCSWEDGILTALVGDALVLEFDTADFWNEMLPACGHLIFNGEALERLWPMMVESDRIRIVLPNGEGPKFRVECLLSVTPIDVVGDDDVDEQL